MGGMAFFQVNLFSPTLCFNTDVCVFVPTPNTDDVLNNKDASYFVDGAKFQVMYLLHGAYGDHTDWFRLTSIEKYATLHRIAVVMPAVANSFYQDMYRGSRYLTYVTEELPRFIEKMFPVSPRREDNFVAGLSMGGYGALKVALEKPEKYCACASLSGAVDLESVYESTRAGGIEGPFRWEDVFERPEAIVGSDADLFALIEKRRREGRPIPRIYLTVGTEDFIYPANLSATARLETMVVDLTYAEHPGIHDWDFWDAHLQDVLDWFRLKNDTIRA